MTFSLRPEFQRYRCWVFDCDGVLLDSNRAKTDAFRDVALAYGAEAAERLVTFHKTNGGISRFVKFRHLFEGILCRSPEAGEMEAVLERFTHAAKARLLECAEAPHLREVLVAAAAQGPLFVVSGGLQTELRDVFRLRGLDGDFTAIFGSPDTKDDILARERASGAMPDPAVFVGDARYDFEVAERYGLDFVFASRWTEFTGWREYFESQKNIPVIDTVSAILADE